MSGSPVVDLNPSNLFRLTHDLPLALPDLSILERSAQPADQDALLDTPMFQESDSGFSGLIDFTNIDSDLRINGVPVSLHLPAESRYQAFARSEVVAVDRAPTQIAEDERICKAYDLNRVLVLCNAKGQVLICKIGVDPRELENTLQDLDSKIERILLTGPERDYKFAAITPPGGTVRGTVSARTVKSALTSIRAQGLYPIEIGEMRQSQHTTLAERILDGAWNLLRESTAELFGPLIGPKYANTFMPLAYPPDVSNVWYSAISPVGDVVKGKVTASTYEEAVVCLALMNLYPTQLKLIRPKIKGESAANTKKRDRTFEVNHSQELKRFHSEYRAYTRWHESQVAMATKHLASLLPKATG